MAAPTVEMQVRSHRNEQVALHAASTGAAAATAACWHRLCCRFAAFLCFHLWLSPFLTHTASCQQRRD